jgi:hypothetical protein
MDYPPQKMMTDGADAEFAAYEEGVRQAHADSHTTVTERGDALIACAEYSRKVDTLDPAQFGLGFCRIHRSVFKMMDDAVNDEGVPRIGSFIWKGEVYQHYFPNGPGFDGIWFGEDTGFFHLCRLIGVTPRIERRTRLIHIGRKAYPYRGG